MRWLRGTGGGEAVSRHSLILSNQVSLSCTQNQKTIGGQPYMPTDFLCSRDTLCRSPCTSAEDSATSGLYWALHF